MYIAILNMTITNQMKVLLQVVVVECYTNAQMDQIKILLEHLDLVQEYL